MNTGNRVLWIVVGLLLLALGVLGTLASLDLLPWFDDATPLLSEDVIAGWRRLGAWGPVVSIAAGLLLFGLGVLLFRAQIRSMRGITTPELVLGQHLRLDGGRDPRAAAAAQGRPAGVTDVDTRTLARALTKDLERTQGVRGASAYLTGAADEPWVNVHLDLKPGVDLTRLHEQVDTALARFIRTSGLPARLADVDVRIVDEPMARVS
ncbi:MAG TPA: hypothetical protein VK028_08270 [Micromonosporaceae bacterium]|nr:hypothetical protein [Micromonosporaceae bacterium]